MDMTENEREEIIALIRAGRPLPMRYRGTLFDDALASELIWPGKSLDVERVVLPFQSIEHIDEPRSPQAEFDLFAVDETSGRQAGGWKNKLVWGDNKLVLSSMADGPMRQEIENAGGLKLVYIDPPFDVGADFSISVEVGGGEVTKSPSIIEEVAYRDTWARGVDSYLSMMRERLVLIRDLLADDGLLWVHLDWRVGHYVKLLLDEVFGRENFINEIARLYAGGGQSKDFFPRKHEPIYLYAKGKRWTFNADDVRVPYDSEYKATVFTRAGSRAAGRTYVPNAGGKVPEDWWLFNRPYGDELLAYPTQKPEALLERIIKVGTNPGDLVADFFCGSGTTLAVAEKLERKWIGVDLGRFAVHTSRKRLIDVQRQLGRDGKPYRSFEILNLGSYERQHLVGIDTTLPENARAVADAGKWEQFVRLVLQAYGAEPAQNLPPFHGAKGAVAVWVGPLDSAVTQRDVRLVVDAARAANIARVDIIGFEFEMGIKPAMADEAKELGVTLTLRYIPNDVFDRRAVSKGQVRFYEVGYVEAAVATTAPRTVTVSLTDFGVFYAQDDANIAATNLKANNSRVIIDNGQVVRIERDSVGYLQREVLTRSWADWIDYWAIDFDYESQKEIERGDAAGPGQARWTGRYIFENQWQSFRTKKHRALELTSGSFTYPSPGNYRIAVKVIDIFGNDTTKVLSVRAE